MLGFPSNRPNWLPPHPLPQASVVLLPLVPRGGTHSLAGEGVGGANSDKGTDTLVGTPTKRQVSKRQVSKRLVSKRPKRQV